MHSLLHSKQSSQKLQPLTVQIPLSEDISIPLVILFVGFVHHLCHESTLKKTHKQQRKQQSK